MKRHCCARRRDRLLEGDVSDGAGGGEHADGDATAAREAREGVDDVGVAGELEDEGGHGGLVRFTRDDDRRSGFVL